MISAKQSTKLKIEAELSLGKQPRFLSNKYDVPYITILGWKKALERDNEDVDVVVQADPALLHTVAEQIKSGAPKSVANKIDKLVEGVTSLQQLEPKFHAVVLNLLEKAEELSYEDDLSIKDWKILGDGISNMYANIFNKAGVSVNVLNQTQVSGEKLSLFKSSMKG